MADMTSRAAVPGYARPEATAAFAARCQAELGLHEAAYKLLPSGPTISSLGVGTYQGELGAEADDLVVKAIVAAVRGGVNVIDTAVNYRLQQGERCVGRALALLFEDKTLPREALFVSTKAGFVPGDYEVVADKEEGMRHTARQLVENGVPAEEICDGFKHTLHPKALDILLAKSLNNLGLQTVDLFYLHNAENQKGMGVSHEELMARIKRAFLWCESMCAAGKIRAYGLATWDCFRVPASDASSLQMAELAAAATAAAHEVHGEGSKPSLTFAQIPINIGKSEAFLCPTQGPTPTVSALTWSQQEGLSVFSSSSLGGGGELPADVASACDAHPALSGVTEGVPRRLQFTRSCPGVCCALVGMKSPSNVAANLSLMKVPPLSTAEFSELVTALFPGKQLEPVAKKQRCA